MIGFVGLVGPHIARMLVGEDQRRAMVFIEACGFRARCDMKRKAALGERVQVVARRANPREDLLMLEEA